MALDRLSLCLLEGYIFGLPISFGMDIGHASLNETIMKKKQFSVGDGQIGGQMIIEFDIFEKVFCKDFHLLCLMTRFFGEYPSPPVLVQRTPLSNY